MKQMILLVVLAVSGLVSAQEQPVPVEEEPQHKMILRNDSVAVMHVTILPERSSLMHTHSRNRLTVSLSEFTIREDVTGNRPSRTLEAHIGDVSVAEYAKRSFTHRVNNIGKTTFDVLDIELLKRPEGPKSGPVAKPAVADESFRAYRWDLAPGASTQQHTHSRPYLIIAATPMQLLMKSPDGASMEHPIKAGDLHWIDSKVTHTLTNNGKESGILIEVELR